MPLVAYGGGGNDDALLKLALMRQMAQSGGAIMSGLQEHREKNALGELLAGKQGPGLGALTQQGAPGMDPSLAGPALGMTGGQQAQPGMLHTGKLTPQMAQAFMLQGGNPKQLAALMPKQMSPYESAQVDIERQKLAKGSGPASGIGKVAADLGLDLSTPEGLAAAQQAMIGSTRAPTTNVSVKMPAPYPAAPSGMHYEGDFGAGSAQLVPTPGYQPEIAADAARNIALTPGILEDMSSVRNTIVSPEGEINRSAIVQMYGNVPGTSGRGLRGKYDAALDWVASHRTGATATPEQIASYKNSFRPSPLDPDAVILDKMARLDREATAALQVATRGRGEMPTPPQVEQPPVPAQPTWMDQGIGALTGAVEQGIGALTGGGTPSQGPVAPPAQAPQMDLSAEIAAGRQRIEELKRKLGR